MSLLPVSFTHPTPTSQLLTHALSLLLQQKGSGQFLALNAMRNLAVLNSVGIRLQVELFGHYPKT